MSLDPDRFKRALRSWPSGVTVVTTHGDLGLHGMTASAFTSVSLSPPLIAVCLGQDTRTLALLERSRVFAVNVLSRTQAAVSNHFASAKTEDARFEGQRYSIGVNGCPLIDGALVQLECEVHSVLTAGDHRIVVGLVTEATLAEGSPLLYWDGGYREL